LALFCVWASFDISMALEGLFLFFSPSNPVAGRVVGMHVLIVTCPCVVCTVNRVVCYILPMLLWIFCRMGVCNAMDTIKSYKRPV
jgi:hypothetical protein